MCTQATPGTGLSRSPSGAFTSVTKPPFTIHKYKCAPSNPIPPGPLNLQREPLITWTSDPSEAFISVTELPDPLVIHMLWPSNAIPGRPPDR